MKRFNKKTILFAAAALVVLVGVVVGVFVLVNRKPKTTALERAGLSDKADVQLAAAHGLSARAPENSAAAFVLAGENGCDGVQFEVRRTADGLWIVMREENIRHMTNGRGKVGVLTYKQILQCRINNGRGVKEYEDDLLRIPTVEQAIAICAKYGMTPVIQVKQSGTEHLDELFNVIGRVSTGECALVFDDGEQLHRAMELLKEDSVGLKKDSVRLCRYVEKLNDKTLAEAKQNPDVVVCFPAGKNKKTEIVRQFADEGLTLCAWTVNRPKQAKALYEAGVRRFTTDRLIRQPMKDENTAIAAKEENT